MSAKNEALKIHREFGQLIADACFGTPVKPFFVAGLMYNEAGRYKSSHPLVVAGTQRAGDYNTDATRFEPGVFEDLINLRDRGFCVVAGHRVTTYNGITRADILEAGDDAIRALSRSYGALQVMGWSMVKMLKGTIADLRDPVKHFHLAVERIVSECGNQIRRGNLQLPESMADVNGSFGDAMRIWNTGRAKGRTYHDNYVLNGLAIMREYAKLPVMASGDAPEIVDTQVVSLVVGSEATRDVTADEIENEPQPQMVAIATDADEGTEDDFTAQDDLTQSDTNADTNGGHRVAPRTQTFVEVPQARPEKDHLAQAEAAATWFKARYAALPTSVIAFVSAVIAWARNSPVQLIIVLVAVAGVVVVVYVAAYLWLKNRREARDQELKLQRERQSHELTVLQAQSAASRTQNTVRIVPQTVRNSD